MVAVFRPAADPNYVEARREFTRQHLTFLFAYVTVIYPLFGGLDLIVYPDHFAEFLRYRVLALVVGVPLCLLSRRMSDRVALGAGVAMVVFETGSIAVMCAATRGFASPYVVGIILCYLGTATIEAFEPRLLAYVLVMLTALYAAINLGVPYRTADATASLCFLTGSAFFCVVCSSLLENQRRRLFAINSELRTRNAELEVAKKHQSKFLSTISHELRSPVNSIVGFSELIAEREEQLQPKSKKNLQLIQQSGQHLLRLINDLLDLAKAEAGRMDFTIEAFDLRPLVLEVADATAALVRGRSVEVLVEMPETCEVQSDPLRIRQILVNLTNNAARFTPQGTITISVQTRHDLLVLEVRDTGVGIPSESQSLIFEAFRQVHEGLGVGGTGLGLSIVSHLVALLGGQIEVESEVGRGSIFRVTFTSILQRVAA
jgi:signal transduction histidine kinase